MKTKWYLLTLIVSLTLLGLGQKEYTVPNQELVVQFSNTSISVENTQAAIADLRVQLQIIGADNILVKEEGRGKLIISYFSTIDPEEIKTILTGEFDLSYSNSDQDQNKSDNSSDKGSKDYDFDVFEIRDNKPIDPVTKGIVFDHNSDQDRYNKLKVFSTSNSKDLNQLHSDEAVVFRTHLKSVLRVEQPAFKIPEVRAGPYYI